MACPAVCFGQCVPEDEGGQVGDACSLFGAQCAEGLECVFECPFDADPCPNFGINPQGHCAEPEPECDEIITDEVFGDASDGKECVGTEDHCISWEGCPLFQPLPPDYCPDGEVFKGAHKYIPSADGMECLLPSAHCVTLDQDACPMFEPLPPGYCADGLLMKGEYSYIASTDGMECRIPSIHCVSADETQCIEG
jgi:hypothetical protein